jgi:hypothetical protein
VKSWMTVSGLKIDGLQRGVRPQRMPAVGGLLAARRLQIRCSARACFFLAAAR